MVRGTYLILCVLPPTLHFSSSTEHQLEVHVTGFRTLTRSNISWYLWISHLWSSFCTHRHMLKKIFYQTSASAWLTFLNICISAWLTFFIKHLHFSMIEFFFYQTSWFLYSGLFCKNICFSAWLTLWWTWRMLLTGEEELTTWSENQIYIQLLNCADDDYDQMLNRSKW